MNIVFEGVNGSGKTTLINNLRSILDKKKVEYDYISDLATNTPLSPVLQQMFSESTFLEMDTAFRTSLYESLVLAADHHYIQEKYRNRTGLVLYDRDFISVLSYQKDIIRKDYPADWEVFYDAFRTIMLYSLKKVDLLCYVSIPVEENIRRTEQRDGRLFSDDEKELLVSLKNNMEQEISFFCSRTGTPMLHLDGSVSPKINSELVLDRIAMLLV